MKVVPRELTKSFALCSYDTFRSRCYNYDNKAQNVVPALGGIGE